MTNQKKNNWNVADVRACMLLYSFVLFATKSPYDLLFHTLNVQNTSTHAYAPSNWLCVCACVDRMIFTVVYIGPVWAENLHKI